MRRPLPVEMLLRLAPARLPVICRGGLKVDFMTSALAGRPYLKMNGLGNSITVLDLRESGLAVSPVEARAIASDSKTNFDQLMVLFDPKTKGTEAFMRIFNTDGSESSACGNGTRCVSWYLTEQNGSDALMLETKAGLLDCRREGPLSFTIDMGAPRFAWNEIPLSRAVADIDHVDFEFQTSNGKVLADPACVNMGNPHAIFFVDDTEAYALDVNGPVLEHDPLFPERANISLVRVVDRGHIIQKVWERGAGLTLACGSGACAGAVASARRGFTDRKVRVTLPGGDLIIDWRESDDHVLMTGPVELEHRGTFDPKLFEGAR
jgi:diaminopimelate epimerase